MAARKLVDVAAATWCGASVIVDALEDPRLGRALEVKCLFRVNDLESAAPVVRANPPQCTQSNG